MPVITTPWNKYEIALLIDACKRIKDGKISRKDAITQLSRRLRAKAIAQGSTISDKYRNENGISWQISNMTYVLEGGNDVEFDSRYKKFKEAAENSISDQKTFSHTLLIAEQLYPIPPEPIEDKGLLNKEDNLQKTNSFACESRPVTFFEKEKIVKVLENKFAKGFRLHSAIDIKRFRKFYKDIHFVELDLDDNSMQDAIMQCGIENNGKIYLPEYILPSDSREMLYSYIEDLFNSGFDYVYYSSVLDNLSDLFLDSYISDRTDLCKYLEYFDRDGWHYDTFYVASSSSVKPNTEKDVFNFVKRQGGLVADDVIYQGLPSLSNDYIKRILSTSPTVLISNGRDGTHFHIDNFIFHSEEKTCIENIIELLLKHSLFTTFDEILEHIQIECHSVIDDNDHISDLGIRNALKAIFFEVYTFNNNIVSHKGAKMDANMVFADFCKNHSTFSVKALLKIAEELGTIVSFDTVYDYSVRLNHDDFIRNQMIEFDIEGTDNAIANFVNGNYVNINDVDTFTLFPECGYPWNTFLLESYTSHYSRRFKLLHHRYNKDAVTGAIVSCSSEYKEFDDVLADIVAQSKVALNESSVLDFLQENKFIIRRSKKFLKDNGLLEKAKNIRMKK